jgi:hypothetical protein
MWCPSYIATVSMHDHPTVTIGQPLYAKLYIATNVIFAHVNAPNPTFTLVDAIKQATLRHLAEVDLPDNAIVVGGWYPQHGIRVDGESLLELIGKVRVHRNPAIMLMNCFFLILP